jgi:Glu-tRNA(Gln) amidotransferase subunit E-like FAD-binding protein
VGQLPWEISQELSAKHGLSQRQVDLLIRAEKVERLHDYVERLKLKGMVAYRLLIELPRHAQRKHLPTTDRIINQIAEGLSRKLVNLQQADQLIEIFVKEPNLSIEEAAKGLHAKRVTEAELDKLIHKQLNAYDSRKLRSDEPYRKRVVSKMVGEVLKAVGYSVEGKKIADKISDLIGKES